MKKFLKILSFFSPIIIVGCVFIVIIIFIAKGCEHYVKTIEEESGKTIIEYVGEKAGNIKREFDKGYQIDSINVDSLQNKYE